MALERVEFMYRHLDLTPDTGRGGKGSLYGEFSTRCTLIVRSAP